jgi:EXLDI family protein
MPAISQPKSYGANVPNKTIYVSDKDLKIYDRAQELAGGNLSSAIASALRRYVDIEEGRRSGYDEITVRVGPGKGRKVRFSGLLLGEWLSTGKTRVEAFRVYRSQTGKFVLHIERSPHFTMVDSEGKPAGWRAQLGLQWNVSYGSAPGESTIEVVESVEALRDKIPAQLFDILSASAGQPDVEDLDI